MASITPETLKRTLTEKLDATHVEVEDVSGGCGQAFVVSIASPQFNGKKSLARHRLTNAALKEVVNDVHAWTLKCYDEDEWVKKQSEEMSGIPAGV